MWARLPTELLARQRTHVLSVATLARIERYCGPILQENCCHVFGVPPSRELVRAELHKIPVVFDSVATYVFFGIEELLAHRLYNQITSDNKTPQEVMMLRINRVVGDASLDDEDKYVRILRHIGFRENAITQMPGLWLDVLNLPERERRDRPTAKEVAGLVVKTRWRYLENFEAGLRGWPGRGAYAAGSC